jgi:hypothetical protein
MIGTPLDSILTDNSIYRDVCVNRVAKVSFIVSRLYSKLKKLLKALAKQIFMLQEELRVSPVVFDVEMHEDDDFQKTLDMADGSKAKKVCMAFNFLYRI